ncbi:hypothetical protein BC937DRAFT_92453 [Endogone sp. FLAS-F59071]|nr:hypothetical protein BC937DRAFT_92453 [Endogone sp. FLAS-F59071]|eukprot:RUS15436.1 hypothetical protein BC937DRAFT_92453 [Endogone sp. FLAS-F59071]
MQRYSGIRFVANEVEEENCGPIPSLDELLDVFTDLAGEDGESEGQVTSSFIQLKTIWRGIQKPLSAPPSSANVILQIKTVDGHFDPETHAATRSILHELDTLAQWLGIAQAGARWTGDADKTGDEATMRAKKRPMGGIVDSFLEGERGLKRLGYMNAQYDIEKMITTNKPCSFYLPCLLPAADVKNEGSAMGIDEEGSVTVDVFSTLSTRKDLDFTERFWKFCQGLTYLLAIAPRIADAQNQDELVDVLTAVIEELETGRLQPMVRVVT